jgi:hypothetical protein
MSSAQSLNSMILKPRYGFVQVLFLEGFYQAAEVKYSASILLVHTARAVHPVDSGSQDRVATYLTQLESVCYANSAMCVIHRSPPHHRRKVAPHVESKSHASAQSVADVVSGGTSLSAALDCIDRSLALWLTPTATWRRILVLEKLHRYARSDVGIACRLLDQCYYNQVHKGDIAVRQVADCARTRKLGRWWSGSSPKQCSRAESLPAVFLRLRASRAAGVGSVKE